jgi:hypothetical protein
MHLKESPASATHYQSPPEVNQPLLSKGKSINHTISRNEKSFNPKNFNRRRKVCKMP